MAIVSISMPCPNCGAAMLEFPVEPAVRDRLPEDRPGASICRRCLTVRPVDDPPSDYPDFRTIDEAFPTAGSDAAVLASILALVDSPALYRQEIDALASIAERRGIDVMLFLDRIARNESLEIAFDLDRRRSQLEQILE